MTRDFEERLRQSLEARAADVAPDPAMFAAVQSRIRRGRMMRWWLAGAGAVAMVAVVALAVPSVLDRRVEFEPGPVATQPPSEAPTPTATPIAAGAMPVAEGVVFSDGSRAYAMALDGESAAPVFAREGPACQGPACGPPVGDIAVRPGSSLEDITVAYAVNDGCHAVAWHHAEGLGGGDSTGSSGTLDDGSCATAPAFSPGGGHAAWVVPEAGGRWLLKSVDWTAAGPGDEDATFGLELPAGGVVQLEDWYWTQQSDSTAAGYIALSVTRDDKRQVYLLAVERQGDGALAVSGDPQPTSLHEGYGAAAFADSQSGDGRITYALLVSRENQQWSVVRSETRTPGMAPDHSAQRDLPETMAPDVPDDLAGLWISAYGDTVAFGDGQGQAWLMEFDETGGGPPREIPATVVHADLFGGGVDAAAPQEPEPSTVTVRVYFGKNADDLCAHGASVTRRVQAPGVARATLNELLAGPTDEEREEGYASPFGPETADALQDVRITDGVAEVDLKNLRGILGDDRCVTQNVSNSVIATVLQFPTVTDVRVSFDGDEAAWAAWLNSEVPGGAPGAVLDTAQRILDAAAARNYDALAELIDRETFSCSFSDQNSDCIALWQQQEAEGQDPLGPLAEILRGEPAKNPDAPIWVWPAEWMTDEEYLGPRTGIQRNGTWRYYQQGGD